MAQEQRILIIDDDPGLRALLAATLGRGFQVEQAHDGQAGIEAAGRRRPDLVLLDITMPGLTGYETCRRLKATPDGRDVPVIFLSALTRLDDRLAAYEAGGDDFVGKPFEPEELQRKAAVTLRHHAERRRLAEGKEATFATAMAAMVAAGETGVMMDFMRKSCACTELAELADTAIAACAALGLSASIQLRGREAAVSRNRAGNSPPIEASVLGTLRGCGRITALGPRLAVNCSQATLMVSDLPVDDPARAGRLGDALAWLAEAADRRVAALDGHLATARRQRQLADAVGHARLALGDIEQPQKHQGASAVEVMYDLVAGLEASFYGLGLTRLQEAAVSSTLRHAVAEVHRLFGDGLAVDHHLRAITAGLSAAGEATP